MIWIWYNYNWQGCRVRSAVRSLIVPDVSLLCDKCALCCGCNQRRGSSISDTETVWDRTIMVLSKLVTGFVKRMPHSHIGNIYTDLLTYLGETKFTCIILPSLFRYCVPVHVHLRVRCVHAFSTHSHTIALAANLPTVKPFAVAVGKWINSQWNWDVPIVSKTGSWFLQHNKVFSLA